MSELSIIPECYADTNLIETLVPPQRGYNHQKGCNTVEKIMKTKFSDKFALAIIDKDEREISYIKECDLISRKASLLLYKHKQKHHYIIQIVPAIERFILNSAISSDISLISLGLSDNLEELKKYTKNVSSKKDTKLSGAFKALKDCDDFKILAAWVKYMKEKQFDIDIERLKEL